MSEYKDYVSVDEIAKDFAIRRHKEVNHFYDALHSYDFHLQMAVDVALEFIQLIPIEDRCDVIGGCWTHDLIEDCRITYNNVKKEINETVAEYSYALANEKGKTRKERANEKYYNGIKAYKHATFIKLCDRVANVKFSIQTNSSMFNVYKNEFEYFESQLNDGRFAELWDHLRNLLTTK